MKNKQRTKLDRGEKLGTISPNGIFTVRKHFLPDDHPEYVIEWFGLDGKFKDSLRTNSEIELRAWRDEKAGV